jgi:hypothetical protein
LSQPWQRYRQRFADQHLDEVGSDEYGYEQEVCYGWDGAGGDAAECRDVHWRKEEMRYDDWEQGAGGYEGLAGWERARFEAGGQFSNSVRARQDGRRLDQDQDGYRSQRGYAQQQSPWQQHERFMQQQNRMFGARW